MLRMSENILYDHAPASTLQRSFEKVNRPLSLSEFLFLWDRRGRKRGDVVLVFFIFSW